MGRFLETPVVKFIAEAIYYMVFVTLLVVYSFSEQPSEGYRLADHDSMGKLYQWYDSKASYPAIGNVYVRVYHSRPITVIITILVAGEQE